MRCPVCPHNDTKVIDSRIAADGSFIRRRRICEKCEFRFSTKEECELLDVVIVKRDGRREAYAREKLEGGLRTSLQKRPHTDADLRGLVSRIERDIQKRRSAELTSLDLGHIVMRRLRGFDKVAYLRFASVYESFEDLLSFDAEVQKLLNGTEPSE